MLHLIIWWLCTYYSNGAADMAAIYYERIDVEGHRFGPSSYQRKNAVKAVDNVLLRMSKLIKVSVTWKLQYPFKDISFTLFNVFIKYV